MSHRKHLEEIAREVAAELGLPGAVGLIEARWRVGQVREEKPLDPADAEQVAGRGAAAELSHEE